MWSNLQTILQRRPLYQLCFSSALQKSSTSHEMYVEPLNPSPGKTNRKCMKMLRITEYSCIAMTQSIRKIMACRTVIAHSKPPCVKPFQHHHWNMSAKVTFCIPIIPYRFPKIFGWLVVYLPLWKMMEFISWDDDIPFPKWWESHKIPWFQSTNQSSIPTNSYKFPKMFGMSHSEMTIPMTRHPLSQSGCSPGTLWYLPGQVDVGRSMAFFWRNYGCFMDVLWMFYGCFMDVLWMCSW